MTAHPFHDGKPRKKTRAQKLAERQRARDALGRDVPTMHPNEVAITPAGVVTDFLIDAIALDNDSGTTGPHAEALRAQMRRQLMLGAPDRHAERSIRA